MIGDLQLLARVLPLPDARLTPSGAAPDAAVESVRAEWVERVRQALLAHPAGRLTYVSCHAAALARDLKSLQTAYELESLCLLDLFPQTGHMEVVAQLSAREQPE